jgi:Transposase DDE domain
MIKRANVDLPKGARSMPTSPLHDSIHTLVQQSLPASIPSQTKVLSLALVGVIQSVSSHLARIARAMPVDMTQESKEQRVRRFLDNPRITQERHYRPAVQQALHGLRGQRVQLLIDRVLLRNAHNFLVVSIGFRRRSIPLVWQLLPHRGSSSLADQQALIAAAAALLPPDVRISVHGDSEFRSLTLFRWLRAQGYDALLGVRGQLWVYLTRDPQDAGQSLRSVVAPFTSPPAVGRRRGHRRSPVTYLTNVAVHQEERFGPVNLLAWWERDDDGREILHGVLTNLPATAQTKAYGTRRMWIETVFRDWQSGGFHLDQCGIPSSERLARLLIILALAYLWLVSLGRWVVKRGYRRLIDDGTPHCWHFSLFQLGVGWKERLASYTLPIPVILFLYT